MVEFHALSWMSFLIVPTSPWAPRPLPSNHFLADISRLPALTMAGTVVGMHVPRGTGINHETVRGQEPWGTAVIATTK